MYEGGRRFEGGGGGRSEPEYEGGEYGSEGGGGGSGGGSGGTGGIGVSGEYMGGSECRRWCWRGGSREYAGGGGDPGENVGGRPRNEGSRGAKASARRRVRGGCGFGGGGKYRSDLAMGRHIGCSLACSNLQRRVKLEHRRCNRIEERT